MSVENPDPRATVGTVVSVESLAPRVNLGTVVSVESLAPRVNLGAVVSVENPDPRATVVSVASRVLRVNPAGWTRKQPHWYNASPPGQPRAIPTGDA